MEKHLFIESLVEQIELLEALDEGINAENSDFGEVLLPQEMGFDGGETHVIVCGPLLQ